MSWISFWTKLKKELLKVPEGDLRHFVAISLLDPSYNIYQNFNNQVSEFKIPPNLSLQRLQETHQHQTLCQFCYQYESISHEHYPGYSEIECKYETFNEKLFFNQLCRLYLASLQDGENANFASVQNITSKLIAKNSSSNITLIKEILNRLLYITPQFSAEHANFIFQVISSSSFDSYQDQIINILSSFYNENNLQQASSNPQSATSLTKRHAVLIFLFCISPFVDFSKKFKPAHSIQEKIFRNLHHYAQNQELIVSERFIDLLDKLILEGDLTGFNALISMSNDRSIEYLTSLQITQPSENTIEHFEQRYSMTKNHNGSASTVDDDVHLQTLAIQHRLLDFAMGFGSFTFFSRNIHLNDQEQKKTISSMLSKFADIACFQSKSFPPHNNDINIIPGNAYVLEGIDISRVFAPEVNIHKQEKDYSYWTDNFIGNSSEQFFDLEYATFVLMRGAIVIIPPNQKRYSLNDSQYKDPILDTSYGIVVYNNHFRSGHSPRCMLVPTDVLNKQINLLKERGSVDKNDFDPIELLKQSRLNGKTPLFPLSASCIGGGLANAFPACSATYFDWESNFDLLTSSFRSDIAGHIASPHRNYVSNLQIAHQQVYGLTTKLINLFDWFLLAESQFNKGLTSTEQNPEQKIYFDQNLEFDPNFSPSFIPLQPVLQQMYYLYRSLKEKNASHSEFPIISVVPTLTMSHAPDLNRFMVDLASLTIQANGKLYSLPHDGDGTGFEENQIWANAIGELYLEPIDFRFFAKDKVM